MITKNEAYWERIARIKEEMLRVAFAENKALTETLAMINPQQSPWREYWEQLLKENEELRAQVKAQRKPLTDEQIAVACGWMPEKGCKPLPQELQIARAIEAAHGIKE